MKWKLLLIGWAVAAVASVAALALYAHSEGSRSAAAVRYPLESAVPLTASQFNLVMAVHPKCPCSRASLQELSHLLAAHPGQLSAQILFVLPKSVEKEFSAGELWDLAGNLPNTQRWKDADGAWSKALGAQTSGHAFLYGADRLLRFSGGITPSRGHQGQSVGAQAVTAWVEGQANAATSSPIFGCALFSEAEENHPI